MGPGGTVLNTKIEMIVFLIFSFNSIIDDFEISQCFESQTILHWVIGRLKTENIRFAPLQLPYSSWQIITVQICFKIIGKLRIWLWPNHILFYSVCVFFLQSMIHVFRIIMVGFLSWNSPIEKKYWKNHWILDHLLIYMYIYTFQITVEWFTFF